MTLRPLESSTDVENDPGVLAPLSAESGGSPSLFEVVRVSLESLFANRMRSLLTMLGVIIGVASIVALLSLGGGVSTAITGQVRGLGANLLTILPEAPASRGPGNAGSAATLTVADANAIAALHLPLDGVSPEFDGNAQIVAPAADKNATIAGVTPASQQSNHLTVASGSFLDDSQVRSASPVAVLGANLATSLFGKGDAVGQTVHVNGQALRVVGVLARTGGSAFGSVDDRALVPITLAQQVLFDGRTADGNSYRVSSITLAAADSTDLPGIQSRVILVLRERHHLAADGTADDFTVIDQKAALGTVNTVTTVLTVFLGCIAGISLVVGGIGIMNIMLVSVTERTREIGLRKAVGAQASDILLQFVAEALVISVLGGLVGLALGGGLATVVTLSGVFSAPVSLSSVAIALGFSMAVGLFFGIYPARRAAGLNPIDALRYE
jgi:putative ABC transport system permease protein